MEEPFHFLGFEPDTVILLAEQDLSHSIARFAAAADYQDPLRYPDRVHLGTDKTFRRSGAASKRNHI